MKRNYFLSVPTLKEFHKNEIGFGYFGYPLGIPKPHRVFEIGFETTDTQRKGSKCFRIFSVMFRNLLNISGCLKMLLLWMKHMKHNERTTSVGLGPLLPTNVSLNSLSAVTNFLSRVGVHEGELVEFHENRETFIKQRKQHSKWNRNLNKFCTNTNEQKSDR